LIKENEILEKSKLLWVLQCILDDNALVFFANLHPVLLRNYFHDDFPNVLRKDFPHFDSFEIPFRDEDTLFILMVDSREKNLLRDLRIQKVPFVDVLSEIYAQ
jgi:hypothetical protein